MKTFNSLQELYKAVKQGEVDKNEMVKVNGEKMKAGRGYVNSILPEGHEFEGRINQSKLKSTLQEISKEYPERTAKIMDDLRKIGGDYIYEQGFSVGLNDIKLLENKDSIVEEARQEMDEAKTAPEISEIAQKYSEKMEDSVKDTLAGTDNNFYKMVRAGSRGSTDQLRQMLGSPLVLKDHENKPVPSIVDNSYAEGLNMGDYFTSLFGARQGVINRRLATAKPGEISKNLIKSVDDQVISIEDCGTDDYITKPVDNKDAAGRILQQNIQGVASKGDVVTPNILSEAKRNGIEEIKVRSPLICEAKKGTCRKCFGTNEFGEIANEGENIGVKASQSLGRVIQQLTMDCTEGIIYNDEIGYISYRDLYNSDHVSSEEVFNKHTWTKSTNKLKIKDNDEYIKTASIQKHYPHDEMYFIRTESGKTLVGQGDHPIWVNGDSIKNIGDLEKDKDKLLIERNHINKEGEKDCPYDPYLIGLFLTEGSTRHGNGTEKYEDVPVASLFTQSDGAIKDKAFEKISDINGAKKRDDEIAVYNPDFAANLMDVVRGREAKYKRLKPGFDKWKNEDLKELLAGYIDGDGTYCKRSNSTKFKIYTSSYILIQQISILAERFNLRFTPSVVTKRDKQHSVAFSAALYFPDDSILKYSEKFANTDDKFEPMKRKVKRGNKEKIKYKKKLWAWNREVWDIKTETCGYDLGGIRNHNSFHTGGAAGAGSNIVSGLPRIKQVLEMPNDISYEATLAEKSGKVKNIKEREGGGRNIIVESQDGEEIDHFAPSDRPLTVEEGDEVFRADKLTAGIPDPAELAKNVGIKETRKRLTDELKASYEGFDINDKMFETVVRGVTDLVRIKDPGEDNDYVPGDYASYSDVHAKNKEKSTKKPVDDAIGDNLTEEYNTQWGLLREGDLITEDNAQYLKEEDVEEVQVAKDPIQFRPQLVGINTISNYKPDSLAQMGFNRIKDAVQGAVAKGTESDIHGYDPIPAYAYGVEFGQSKYPGSY